MKQSSLVLLLLAAVALPVCTAQAQVSASAYAEGNYTYLQNDQNSENLYGGTGGIMLSAPSFSKLKLVPSFDVQGRFTRGKNGADMNGVTIGPRVALDTPFLSPFFEFEVGFARYKDNANIASTDYIFGGELGVARKITPHFDVTASFSYDRFGYNLQFYDPYVVNAGVVYHFSKR